MPSERKVGLCGAPNPADRLLTVCSEGVPHATIFSRFLAYSDGSHRPHAGWKRGLATKTWLQPHAAPTVRRRPLRTVGMKRVYEWSFDEVADPLSTGTGAIGIGRLFFSWRNTDGATGGLREEMAFAAE